jgi:hypothetical protein
MKRTFKTNGRLLSEVFSSYTTTFDALCELINNSIQANSTIIEIEADLVDDEEGPKPFPFTEYRIIDNGEGVSASEFGRKILQIATDAKGSKGIGRFAAFQIGSTIIIKTTAYDKQRNKYTNTSVTLNAHFLSNKDISEYDFEVSDNELKKRKADTFYKITIKDFWDEIETEKHPKKKLIQKLIPGKLEEALFLKYSSYIVTDKINFITNGNKLSKNDFLVGNIEKESFEYTFSDSTTDKILLEYVNYKGKGKNKKIILAYRVDNSGIKLSGYEDFMNLDYPDDNSWLVYIDCDYFNSKADTFRNLFFDGLDEDMSNIKNQVKDTVRNFIKEKHKEFFAFKASLLEDEYYPYKGASDSSSREFAFNHLAFFIEKDYSILQKKEKLRQIVYPLLDKAISNGDIEGILQSIISLNDEQVAKFRELLKKADISDIIRFTTDIVEKQRFLDFLNEIIYGDIAKHILERKQLHKIIERHLWLFGEEYSVTPVLFSDKSFKNNLEALREKYFKNEKSEEDENYFDITDQGILDIPDLWFFNEKPLANGKHEIMIIELKAPRVRISQKELNQVDKYKYDIERLDKFSKNNISYRIYLISSGITPLGESKIGGVDVSKPAALYSKSKEYDIEVYVMKWSDIIARNRQHLKYLGNYLETKDIDVKQIFETEYSDLDISTIITHTQKERK